MREKQPNNSNYIIRLPFLLSIAICIGIYLGANWFSSSAPTSGEINSNAGKFRDVLGYIERYYVDTVDLDELTEHAIEEVLTKLDPHTAYIPAKDYDMANAPLQGDFEGIGIEFNIFKDTINVVAVLPEGPSEKAGLKPGDKLLEVDGENLAGINVNNRKVVEKLRGKKGTNVEVKIKRRAMEEPLSFTIKRDKIPTTTVEVGYMIDEKTGYIKVTRFGAKTYDEFESALSKLVDQGMGRLVLDLRDNLGGYMDKAISIADEFLAGSQLIVYTDGQGTQFDDEANASKKGLFEAGSLVVLINENSASASEIVAGALQDNDRALIAGRRSFGKGLVQREIRLDDNSALRLTISRYYTPSGRSIQKPYGDGTDYSHEIQQRYAHGELFNKDSIIQDTENQYATSKGRTVYGGGGIMPDFFIPQDTSYYSTYLNKLISKNLLREYAYNYAAEHREELTEMGLHKFKQKMYINENIMRDFVAFSASSGVPYNDTQFLISKGYIENYLKAFVARAIWKDEGFYQVYNQFDNEVIEALKLFDKAEDISGI
ncbi:S41 family peptidase [Flammeovirgaceae bacterium SG7u.111]|nr:S41 family peptidase [Flammeovirgaceae bacterium SG7u.132]WPO33095.1 S41 family peptidase [Flammeovirgaceae bacterium SG7u.111]